MKTLLAIIKKKFGAAFGQEARLRWMTLGDRLRRSCVCACDLLKRMSVSSRSWDHSGHVALRFFPDMLLPRLAGRNVGPKTRVEPDFEFVSRGRSLKFSGASKAWALLNSRLQSLGVLCFCFLAMLLSALWTRDKVNSALCVL